MTMNVKLLYFCAVCNMVPFGPVALLNFLMIDSSMNDWTTDSVDYYNAINTSLLLTIVRHFIRVCTVC